MCCRALLGLTMNELLVVLAGEPPRESERHAGQRLDACENTLSSHETAILVLEQQEYLHLRAVESRKRSSTHQWTSKRLSPLPGRCAPVPGYVKLATKYVTSATACVLIVVAAHTSVVQVVEMIQEQNVASKEVALDAVSAPVVKYIAPAIDVHAAPASVAERVVPAPVVDLTALFASQEQEQSVDIQQFSERTAEESVDFPVPREDAMADVDLGESFEQSQERILELFLERRVEDPPGFTMAIPRSCVTSRNKHETFKAKSTQPCSNRARADEGCRRWPYAALSNSTRHMSFSCSSNSQAQTYTSMHKPPGDQRGIQTLGTRTSATLRPRSVRGECLRVGQDQVAVLMDHMSGQIQCIAQVLVALGARVSLHAPVPRSCRLEWPHRRHHSKGTKRRAHSRTFSGVVTCATVLLSWDCFHCAASGSFLGDYEADLLRLLPPSFLKHDQWALEHVISHSERLECKL